MLVACTKPLFVLFHQGYIRKSMNDYNLGKFKKFIRIVYFLFFKNIRKC